MADEKVVNVDLGVELAEGDIACAETLEELSDGRGDDEDE